MNGMVDLNQNISILILNVHSLTQQLKDKDCKIALKNTTQVGNAAQ
jgi:hypothetical protein